MAFECFKSGGLLDLGTAHISPTSMSCVPDGPLWRCGVFHHLRFSAHKNGPIPHTYELCRRCFGWCHNSTVVWACRYARVGPGIRCRVGRNPYRVNLGRPLPSAVSGFLERSECLAIGIFNGPTCAHHMARVHDKHSYDCASLAVVFVAAHPNQHHPGHETLAWKRTTSFMPRAAPVPPCEVAAD